MRPVLRLRAIEMPQASGHQSLRGERGPKHKNEPPTPQCYKNGLVVVGGLEANGLEEDPVMNGLVDTPAGWLSGLWPSLAEPKSPKEEPFCCGGNSGVWQVPTKAPVGGTIWGKPGPALFIPKLGPGARPLVWKGLVDGSTV